MADAYENERADKLVLLGDLLYHGPRNILPKKYDPQAVAALLNSMKSELLCVRGNCDCEVDQMLLEVPILSDYALLYADGLTIFATHGHIYNETALPPLLRGQYSYSRDTRTFPARCAIKAYIVLTPVRFPCPNRTSSAAIWCMKTVCLPSRILKATSLLRLQSANAVSH